MYISRETPEQIDKRLRKVIAAADLVRYEGAYSFHEYPIDELPSQEIQDCFALVRDDEVWSVLKRAESGAKETFGLFSFHFVDDLDNSGFVGWLATIMKRELGTGVLVVCGYNSKRGGVFDYWGVPVSLRDKVAAIVEELRRSV